MTNYDKLISYLPSIYQKTNNLKLMQSIAILFDNFDKDLKSIDKMWVVEEATGAYLDVIGNNLQVYRELNQNDSVYKTKIKSTFDIKINDWQTSLRVCLNLL